MSERQTLTVHGVDIVLESTEGVFTPSAGGLFYARSLTVHPGERVLDIGTGSGILAILAARLGARVEATDVDPRAVAAAGRNAALNGVTIHTSVGSLFGDSSGIFDVIVANLPNEIVAPKHLGVLGPDARTVSGGERGNEHILALIGAARAHMGPASRLYLPIHTLTDYHATLRAAIAAYRLRLVAMAPIAVKSFVTENLDWYRDLDESGVISIFRQNGQWFSDGYVYEATLAAPSDDALRPFLSGESPAGGLE